MRFWGTALGCLRRGVGGRTRSSEGPPSVDHESGEQTEDEHDDCGEVEHSTCKTISLQDCWAWGQNMNVGVGLCTCKDSAPDFQERPRVIWVHPATCAMEESCPGHQDDGLDIEQRGAEDRRLEVACVERIERDPAILMNS